MNEILVDNGAHVDHLRGAILRGGEGLKAIPGLVKMVLESGAWRERYEEGLRRVVKFDKFEKFVTTPPLDGLGADLKIIKDMCHDRTDIIDLLDRETVEKQGTTQRWESDTNVILHYNIMKNNEGIEQGTSSQYAIRKLRKDRPDIHTRVIKGELSPHAGMIEAGFREKTVSVPVNPQKAAQAITRHFSKDEILVLMAVLAEYCLKGETP